jgi:hypothetical protein
VYEFIQISVKISNILFDRNHSYFAIISLFYSCIIDRTRVTDTVVTIDETTGGTSTYLWT